MLYIVVIELNPNIGLGFAGEKTSKLRYYFPFRIYILLIWMESVPQLCITNFTKQSVKTTVKNDDYVKLNKNSPHFTWTWRFSLLALQLHN
ncbi:conserved protein of unknown function [Alteromonas macleodii]|uniref:Uncharacterized protein n=1 Tax=Alteromonas macleodii TaxID=28108 RepID=A0A6T9Y4R6_ALTMA|nr:conserved protein of unknown function [Alteromonas macleodii]